MRHGPGQLEISRANIETTRTSQLSNLDNRRGFWKEGSQKRMKMILRPRIERKISVHTSDPRIHDFGEESGAGPCACLQSVVTKAGDSKNQYSAVEAASASYSCATREVFPTAVSVIPVAGNDGPLVYRSHAIFITCSSILLHAVFIVI